MIRTIEHGAFHIDHGVARNNAFGHSLLHALVDRRDQAARNRAALNGVDEFITAPGIGLQAQPAVAELARAASLLLVATLGFSRLANGLAIRNAHRNKLRLDLRLGSQTAQNRINLSLAHCRNHRLVRILMALNANSRIVFRNACKEGSQLVFFLLVHGLNGDGVLRNGERQRGDGNAAAFRKRVARARFDELRHHHDVARHGAFHRRGFLALHHAHMAQALLFAGTCVQQFEARHQRARKHLHEAQAANIGVGQSLEHEARRLAFFRNLHFAAVGRGNGAMRRGMREVGANVFHKALNALLDDGGTHEHGNEQLLRDGLVEQALEFCLSELLFTIEVFHHKVVVGFGNQVAQLVARHLGLLEVFIGNFFHALRIAFEIARLHTQNVDDALEIFVDANGNGYHAQTRAETGVQRGHDDVEVRMLTIDVVDEHRTRQAHGLGLAPQLRGHDLRALYGVDHEHGHFGGVHGRERVANEVGVARRVEQVDLVIFIRNGRDRRAHSELALDFLGIVVEVRFSVVRSAHARRLAGNVEHGFGQ